MKKVIDGKIYNTETAEQLGSYWNGKSEGDFQYVYEFLYRTKKGRFFLAGEGGAMSHYCRRCGDNTWCEGKGIIPLEDNEAREWAESHWSTEDYIAIFGEPEEA